MPFRALRGIPMAFAKKGSLAELGMTKGILFTNGVFPFLEVSRNRCSMKIIASAKNG